MRAAKRPLTILVLLLSVLVFASACAASNDPQSWTEAEEDGNLQFNFIRACTEASAEGGAVELTDAQAAAHCECAFVEIVEYYGGKVDGEIRLDDEGDAVAVAGRDFEAFKDLESSLRDDPASIPADIEAILKGCANSV